MTSTEQLVEQLLEADNEHDTEKSVDAMADECVLEDVAFGRVIRGKGEWRAYHSALLRAVPDLKLTSESLFATERFFVAEVILFGTHEGDLMGIPATGRRFSVRACIVGEVENGKLKRRRVYWDLVALIRQLGLMGLRQLFRQLIMGRLSSAVPSPADVRLPKIGKIVGRVPNDANQ